MPVEFVIPRQIKLADLKRRLSTQFPIREEAPIKLQRVYQDSFDWLLYQSGYRYFVEHYDDVYQLNLQGLKSEAATRSVSQQQWPHFADAVQSTVFRRRLAAMLNIRALMTRATLLIRRHTLRYLDQDEKTRLLIRIDEYRLPLDKGRSRDLGKRLQLLPVRGYRAPVEQISQFLRDQYQLTPADGNIHRLVLEHLGLDPQQDIAGVTVDIDAQMRTDLAMKHILIPSLQAMRNNLQGTIEDIDSEFLHDYRVAVRRTRSALSLIKQVFPQQVVDRFNSGFKWLGSITGPTRDMHVYLLKFPDYQQQLPETMRNDLEPMRAFLQAHLQLEHKALVKHLKSARHRQLLDGWEKFLQSPVPQRSSLDNAMVPVGQTADHYIWQAYQKVIRQGGKINAKSADEKLHKLRITCKKLRYLLEFFTDLYAKKKMKSLIRSLKNLQNILGDFQDLSVQVESINHIREQMREEGLLNEATDRAMNQLNRHFLAGKKALRKQYADSFSQFAAADNHKIWQSLFGAAQEKA